ncbi:hypothetical protein OROMI_027339 [Orobanche minor]
MASAADNHLHRNRQPAANISLLLHAASTNIFSFLSPKSPSPPPRSSKIHLPVLLSDPVLSLASPSESAQPDPTVSTQARIPPPSFLKAMPSSETGSGSPSTVRISTRKGGGPAFVGQVFSMCDLSGTGLMAVSTHFDIPFLSKRSRHGRIELCLTGFYFQLVFGNAILFLSYMHRTPEWLKKIFAAVTKSERNGPMFRFFMDLGDADGLNVPSGVVGACRLDIAYEQFKEKPHMFQFVPNERQVKEANKLLKIMPHNDMKKKVEGVPVFSAENLDIAIATKDGIKWYTPYFFDKNTLDNILEESTDQHFHALIETRHIQRQGDVGIDDSLSAEAAEEMEENVWDPPQIQEVLDEMGSGIPLSIISKAAEIQLLYAVDKVLLGNRWMRKATRIQPKFPYMIDSFERNAVDYDMAYYRSTASFLRAENPSRLICNSEFGEDAPFHIPDTLEVEKKDKGCAKQGRAPNFQFPFRDWFSHPSSKQQEDQQNLLSTRDADFSRQEVQSSTFLPKITMVGISTGEPGKMSKAALKKTMDDLTKELEEVEQVKQTDSTNLVDERDPLFVANVGDYVSNTGSARWIRGGSY